jgi:hypothetical protein
MPYLPGRMTDMGAGSAYRAGSRMGTYRKVRKRPAAHPTFSAIPQARLASLARPASNPVRYVFDHRFDAAADFAYE